MIKRIIVIFVMGVVMIVSVYLSRDTNTSLQFQTDKAVLKYSAMFGIEVPLLRALIQQEGQNYAFSSRFDRSRLIGKSWALDVIDQHKLDPKDDRIWYSMGLLQVLYLTAVDLGYKGEPEGLFCIDTNVLYACKNIQRIRARWTKILDVISAYNQGGGYWIDLDGDKIHDANEPYKNATYVSNVYKEYKELGGIQ